MTVRIERHDAVMVVTIDRPEIRNAVDGPTAQALADAFRDFATDDAITVGVLTGAAGHFCSGADLKAMAEEPERANRVQADGDGPMGPTRMFLDKPVIAAIEGYAVAGGLELALWCDLRVAATDAKLGFFDRRWGVPLIDGGTIRLPRLIGHGRALDLLLTGRELDAAEAHQIGLVNRVVEPGRALAASVELAATIARFPQNCLRSDRRSSYEQWDLPFEDALRNEFRLGLETIASGEPVAGAGRFTAGRGRHGTSGVGPSDLPE
ncbi:MAG: crotonase/enoyl-CoA hydratase family protein [Actinomycetota bacterium]|nr:crotonase/enoyl-CoA hydratase family protein [Actinomycetota bacterium]